MARGRGIRRWIDEWHGTAARTAGFGLLAYSAVVDRFKNPALLVGAVGLIALKNVTGKNRDDEDGE